MLIQNKEQVIPENPSRQRKSEFEQELANSFTSLFKVLSESMSSMIKAFLSGTLNSSSNFMWTNTYKVWETRLGCKKVGREAEKIEKQLVRTSKKLGQAYITQKDKDIWKNIKSWSKKS